MYLVNILNKENYCKDIEHYYQQIDFLKNTDLRGKRNGLQTNHSPVFHMENTYTQEKDFFYFSFYCFTSAFLKQMFLLGFRTKKNSLFTQLCVQPSSDIPYLTVHIPISQSAYEYPRFIHAAMTPSTNQQFLAKSSSTWQMMT